MVLALHTNIRPGWKFLARFLSVKKKTSLIVLPPGQLFSASGTHDSSCLVLQRLWHLASYFKNIKNGLIMSYVFSLTLSILAYWCNAISSRAILPTHYLHLHHPFRQTPLKPIFLTGNPIQVDEMASLCRFLPRSSSSGGSTRTLNLGMTSQLFYRR